MTVEVSRGGVSPNGALRLFLRSTSPSLAVVRHIRGCGHAYVSARVQSLYQQQTEAGGIEQGGDTVSTSRTVLMVHRNTQNTTVIPQKHFESEMPREAARPAHPTSTCTARRTQHAHRTPFTRSAAGERQGRRVRHAGRARRAVGDP